MSDAQEFVLSRWPRASCFEANLFWPGQGTNRRWIVTSAPHMSRVEASGVTEVEAWAKAANRIAALEAKEGKS